MIQNIFAAVLVIAGAFLAGYIFGYEKALWQIRQDLKKILKEEGGEK